jgi:hypothetical protein
MVETYKCGTPECKAKGEHVPWLQVIRSEETSEPICGLCRQPMKIGKTSNSKKRPSPGRSPVAASGRHRAAMASSSPSLQWTERKHVRPRTCRTRHQEFAF